MKKLGKINLLISLVIIMLFFTACGNKESSKESDKTTFSTTSPDVVTTMDSHLNTVVLGSQQLKNTMEGLYRFKGNKLVPGLAKEIVTPTNNGKKYIFNLRKSNWSNGAPLTAKDFVYSWKRIVNPKTGSTFSYVFSGIKNADKIIRGQKNPDTLGIKALSKYQLEVDLEHTISYFNELTVTSRFLPVNQKAVESSKGLYGTNSKNVVYNGPFKMVNWKVGDTSWKLVKNDQYWNAKNVKLKTLNYSVVKDSNTGMNLYDTKKIDRFSDLSGETAVELKNKPDFVSNDSSAMSYLAVNQKDNQSLKNTKIRQAISNLINRDQLANKILGDTVKPATSMVPVDTIFNKKTKIDFKKETSSITDEKYTNYNPKLAKELWKKGIKETGIKNFKINLVTDDQDASKKISEYLQSNLESNLDGLKVNVTNVPYKSMLQKGNSGDFDLILTGWLPDYPDPCSTLDLFTTNNSMNVGKWSNKDYDRLQNLSSTTDANNYQKRWNELLDQQHILTKEQGVIPLYQKKVSGLMRDNVKNYVPGPDGFFYIADTYKE